jgi:hypothetical protein
MKNMQWITRTLAIIFLLYPAMNSQALARSIGHSSHVTIEVISDQRGILTKYAAGRGNEHAQRSYVIARDNERYSILVRNRTNERIGLVIAVDGRNIISGGKSYLKPHERMYILEPYQSAEYQGWRTSRNRVNRFYFTNMNDSYAASWGDYTAMGVIAVAVYRNQHKDVFSYKGKEKKTRPMDQPRANGRRENPGTGFGESEWSPSRTVHFSPQKRPVVKEFIKYEWRSTLCRERIISCRKKRERHGGNRFWPDHSGDHGFAPFPPLWPFR